jgi:hypothetical protein
MLSARNASWEDHKMADYQFTCPCGHQIKMAAGNRDEAVSKIQGAMDEKAIAAHFKEKHPGQQVMSVGSVHALIAQGTVQA